jgi:hypothetical protein
MPAPPAPQSPTRFAADRNPCRQTHRLAAASHCKLLRSSRLAHRLKTVDGSSPRLFAPTPTAPASLNVPRWQACEVSCKTSAPTLSPTKPVNYAATAWQYCSVTCGQGVQQRTVYCSADGGLSGQVAPNQRSDCIPHSIRATTGCNGTSVERSGRPQCRPRAVWVVLSLNLRSHAEYGTLLLAKERYLNYTPCCEGAGLSAAICHRPFRRWLSETA